MGSPARRTRTALSATSATCRRRSRKAQPRQNLELSSSHLPSPSRLYPPNSAGALAREFGFAPNSAPGSRRSLPSIFFSLFWRSWRSTNNFFERPVPDSTGTGRGFLETYFLVEFFAQTVVELR